MKTIRPVLILGSALCAAASLFLFTACEIDGGDEIVREVSLRISGSYQNTSGIPTQQSGQRITLLSINQSGDQLEAVDNAGARWSGTIGSAQGDIATFTLDGSTSAGKAVVLTGSISVEGTTATLTGTWIEPDLRAPAFAQAVVAPQPTATPVPQPTDTPTAEPTVEPTPAI